MKSFLLTAAAVLAGCSYHHADDRVAPAVAGTHGAPASLARLERHATVRVFSRDERLDGAFVAVDSQFITVRRGQSPAMLRLTDVDSVLVHRNRTGSGALIGGIPLAVLGALFLGSIVSAMCETDDCQTAQAAMAGGVLGLAIGGGTGALIGFAASGWERVYPVRP